MFKSKKRLGRVFSVVALAFVLTLSSLTVSAATETKPKTNDELVQAIINDKDTKVSLTNTSEGYKAEVTMDFHIKDADWVTIQSLTDPLELKFPDSMKLAPKQDLKFANTDKNFKDNVYQSLEDTRIKTEDNTIAIDFKELTQRPQDFRLVYELDIVADSALIDAIDLKVFPVVAPLIKDTVAFINKVEDERVAALKTAEDTESEAATNNTSEVGNSDTDKPETVKPDTETPNGDTETSEETNETVKTQVSGDINIELVGNPQARVKHANKEINDSYPIAMTNYSETATNYSIDLFTDENPTHLGVSYVVKLDDQSLALITEENKANALDFQYKKNGVQVPFKYEYAFPEVIKFYDQTGDSILASSKLSDYSTSSFKRVAPGTNEGPFKLDVEEIKIDSNVEGAAVQYKFQDFISTQISNYINEELQAGKSLTEIKAALKQGVVVTDDQYKVNDYQYQQNTKASFEKLNVYPLEIKNILNSQKDIKKDLPVTPVGGVDNTLEAKSFEQVPNGFELIWEGVANTNRKSTLNTLDLSFDAPTVVKTSGLANWNIKTVVNVSYYDVLNDGTLVPNTTLVPERIEKINAATDKIEPISIDTHGQNVAIKYDVTQTFINNDLNLEIEGNQVGRLSAALNKNQFNKSVENKKEFPRSIVINGVKGAEGAPTSLHWDVVFNNNKLIRQPNDGFNFYLDASKVKAYRFNGSGDSYSEINVAYNQMKIKTTIFVDGKEISKDGRFTVEWNADFTEAKIRLKPGLAEPLNKEVKFQFKYEIDVVEPYVEGKAIRDELLTSSKLKFEGNANVKSFTNGIEIEPTKPTEEELKAQQALNYLVLLDKRPVMIDYRTKEVIWGVAINTVTANRIGLEGFTYSDTFKSPGMFFEPMDENNPILMFKIDPTKQPQTSHGEYSKFISEVKKIMDNADIYSDEIANAIVGAGGLLGQKLDDEAEDSKTYGDIVSYVNPSEIAYLKDDASTLTNEKFALSQPKEYPGYVDKLKGKVVNGEPGDPFVSTPTKSELLKGVDLRLDFIDSNKAIGPAGGEDDNAYYILYKTKLSSDTPMESVKNAGALTFATWVIGEGNTISWTGGDIEASKDLGEVAKYNTVPKKEGTVKVINDAATNRQRLAANWNITFNYDVDTRRVAEVPMVVVDTIDKNRDIGGFTLGNKHLVPQEIEAITLAKFEVDKDGNLKPTNETVEVTKASGELTVDETADKITYTIKKHLDPKYVYRFEINTLIESHEAVIPVATEEVSNTVATGEFENTVTYTRGHEPNQVDLPEPGVATAKANLGNRNRVQKTGSLVSGTYPGSRQQVQWTLTLNETYENMSNIVIKDTLESKHTFKFIKDHNDLEQSGTGNAVLDRFSIQELVGSSWRTIPSDKYVLTNPDGDANKPLDNWTTGESGFILRFTEAMSNPIRIQYATFGHVVDNKEIPLKNHADLSYTTDAAQAIDHKVTAAVNFKVNDEAGGYEDERFDIGLTMRYNDNQPALTTDLDKGERITGNNVEQSIIVLYRYQNKFVENNHVYRIGQPDANGYLEFKNIEKGNYIVKQFNVADGYSVPNSLGYVESGRNTTKDKSVEINASQLASGNLVTLDVKDPSKRMFDFFKADPVVTKVDYAIYNTTPVFEVKTDGKLVTATGADATEKLSDINLDITNEAKQKAAFRSSDQGTFKVGTVNPEDDRIDFGKFVITQPTQTLNGYLRNTETVNHTLARNPNGTVDATTINATFNNYKTSATMKVVHRGTENLIANSAYTLEQYDGTAWVPYEAASTGKGDANAYTLTNGKLTVHNLDAGRYRFNQTAVGDGYLINPEPLEFYVYGPTQETATDAYEGKPEVMQLTFDNIKASVNFSNVIGTETISGSTFDIKDASDTVVDTFTITDKDAGYTRNLAPGTYSLVQTGTSDNRPLNASPMTFEIESDEGIFEGETEASTRTIVFENHLGSFEFATHTPSLATFDIESYALDYNATAVATPSQVNLGYGNYEVKDVQINNAWIHVPTDYTFVVPQSYTDPATLKQTVHVYGTQVNMDYVNRDGDVLTDTTPLTGGTFSLTEETSNTLVASVNESNPIRNIGPGTYAFAQTNAPQGYGLNTAILANIVVPQTLSQNDVVIDTVNHTIENYNLEPITYYNYRGKVVLTKTSAETNSPLAGVVFNLYHEGVKLDGEYVTDTDGKITIDRLAPGNYYFEEIKGDGNHIANASKTPFTIAASNENAYAPQTVAVSNYYADVVFKNTNPDHDVIYTDGTFTLLSNENGTWTPVNGFIDFKVTPQTDTFKIFGVKAGSYKLVQTKAPTHTVRNTFEYLFDIPDYTPEEIEGRLTLELDDYINYQATLKVDLIDPNGAFTNNVDATFNDASGRKDPMLQVGSVLTRTGLGSGNYSITTNKADQAIVVDETLDVVVPESALNDEGLALTKTLRVTYARNTLKLVDGRTSNALGSGIFTINDVEYKVSTAGVIKLDALTPGTYSYVQTQAADGYVLNTLNQGSFEVFGKLSDFEPQFVNREGFPYVDLQTTTFNNYRVNVIINKVDDKDRPLQGVEFTLTHDADNTVVTTNAQGQAIINDRAPGAYVLKETKALPGYEGITDAREFIIESEYAGEPQDIIFKVTNKEIIDPVKPVDPTLPSTGMAASTPWFAFGIVALGGIFIVASRRRKHQ
ncbi:LPXTG cell wall anchor domain-containing protein [Erysipelothrix sp. HDW6B]|uniref:LPXTG cell wall anchor domain-containing protein n=1 Tax=Erysipelothrix sp. HDW6B TaxID=2714929 RepID=UPI001408DB00|nr:LPXTG cell wall anchor domain-containing protein [Erysipelothrix sp. HDW6B]QIK86417.1 LPXTG cell wall anchor domain-containing protein [Erysipelothrix sp. HDW6B]